MGACISFCLPSSGSGENKRDSEQTPLLQDPSLILHEPPRHNISAVESPDEAELERILEQTSSGLIDIKATHNGDSRPRMKYLIDRLQMKASQDSLIIHQAPDSPPAQEGVGQPKKYSTQHKLVMKPSKDPITSEESKLLNSTSAQLKQVLQEVSTRKKVDDVIVKLRWD